MNLYEKIKQLRIEAKMTQESFGKLIGVSEKVISKWENGDTLIPADKLPAIADAFGTNIDDLFGHTHDLSTDIQNSIEIYMESIPPCDAIKAAQHLVSYIILGAQIRNDRDAGYYSDKTISELKDELKSLIESDDERPQRYWHEEKHDVLHDYQNGSMDHYLCSDLLFTVLQSYPTDVFNKILDNYHGYIKVFEFLSRPDAHKLLQYRYSDKMPDNFTESYLAEDSGASPETVKMFLEINDCYKAAQYVMIDGEQQLMYEKPTICGSQSTLQTIITAAYAFAVKRNGGNR